jgi:hypothetical protein
MFVTFSFGTKSPRALQLNGWLPGMSGCVSPHVPMPGIGAGDIAGLGDGIGLVVGLGLGLVSA